MFQSQTVTIEKLRKTLSLHIAGQKKVGEIDTLGQFHRHSHAKLLQAKMLRVKIYKTS